MRRLFVLIACCSAIVAGSVTRTQVMMGTFAFVQIDEKQYALADKAFRVMKKVEKSLSSFDKDATLYRLNHNRSIVVDNELLQALRLAKMFYKQTYGYFDITIGSITKNLFRFGSKHARLPSVKELENASLGIDKIDIRNNTVSLSDGILLDFGGMGKGYAVDKATSELMRYGVKKAILGLSGDIRCIGACSVDIQNPFSEGTIAKIESTSLTMGISTSGPYCRFVKNQQYNHLIDPKRKRNEKYFSSVTLIGDVDNVRLDAYATAISVMPPKVALQFLKSYPMIEYLLIAKDGTMYRKSKKIRIFSPTGLILFPKLSLKQKARILQRASRSFPQLSVSKKMDE